MAWFLIPLAGAALGAIQGNKQRNNDIANNEMQAELTKYSPWTGIKTQISPVSGGWMSGAMQGGMSGLALAQGMKNAGMFNESPKASTLDLSSEAPPETGWSTLDGSRYLRQPELGSQYTNNRRYL